MSEFSNRIEAQRRLLKLVNDRPWPKEQLFSLNERSIDRWVSSNSLDHASKIVQLLRQASNRIFAMANHSDDPICGEYRLSEKELVSIGGQLTAVLTSNPP